MSGASRAAAILGYEEDSMKFQDIKKAQVSLKKSELLKEKKERKEEDKVTEEELEEIKNTVGEEVANQLPTPAAGTTLAQDLELLIILPSKQEAREQQNEIPAQLGLVFEPSTCVMWRELSSRAKSSKKLVVADSFCNSVFVGLDFAAKQLLSDRCRGLPTPPYQNLIGGLCGPQVRLHGLLHFRELCQAETK